jgi:hypothetical protein
MCIPEIHHKLPKNTFTLTEWDAFCRENPQWLTTAEIKPTTLAISQGISNIEDLTNPLEILQKRLERAKIVERQKQEFHEIYELCRNNRNYEHFDKEKGFKYKIQTDLLLVKRDKTEKSF